MITHVYQKRPAPLLPNASLGYLFMHSHSSLPQTITPRNIKHDNRHGHLMLLGRGRKQHIRKRYEVYVAFWILPVDFSCISQFNQILTRIKQREGSAAGLMIAWSSGSCAMHSKHNAQKQDEWENRKEEEACLGLLI